MKKRTNTNRVEPIRAVRLQGSPLSYDALMWLDGRGISVETAEHFGLYSTRAYIPKMEGEVECIGFPYREAPMAEAYAAKLRALDEKAFTQKGAAQTFFGIDRLPPDVEEVVIVEGEMDALACYEAGCKHVISVPNGAVLKASEDFVSPEDDKKFQYVWRAAEFLEGLKRVIIAVDMDEKGEALAEEISRRIGRGKCWQVEWSAKDANDVLKEYGADQVVADLTEAEPLPVVGLYEADTFYDKLVEIYDKGMGRGASTGYPQVDEYMTVMPGQVSIVTGVPSHGKSEFVDQLMVNLAEAKNWRFAIASFENEPELHIAKLVSKQQRGQFFKHGENRITKEQMQEGFAWVKQHFTFVHQSDGELATIESLLERFRVAVMRYGIRGAVIDPYNYIRRDDRFSETDWISQMLTMVVNFARSHGVHIWFIAHPRILRPREDGTVPVPKGYDISGCYSDDTEVLTDKGWVPHPNITSSHRVACYDPSDGSVQYHCPEHVHIYDHQGVMHHWSGAGLDMMVTPNHRMLVKPAYRLKPKKNSPITGRPATWDMNSYQFVESQHITGTRWSFPMGGIGVKDNLSAAWIELDDGYEAMDFWRLVGFWVAEGCVQMGGLSFSQAEEMASYPAAIMDRLGLSVKETLTHYRADELPLWTGRIYKRKHPELCEWVIRHCGEGALNKKVPVELFSASAAEKEAFLEGYLFGDGHVKGNTIGATTVSPSLAGDIQRIAIELGLWCHVRNDGRAEPHHSDRYAITIRQEESRTVEVRRNRSDVEYDGKVYCLTVPTGAYITRRNGRMAIAGNSAAWFSKADLGITVHRDTVNEPDLAEIHVWKCRFQWIGKQGQTALLYDTRTTRYYEPGMDSTDIEYDDDDFNLEPVSKDIPWLEVG